MTKQGFGRRLALATIMMATLAMPTARAQQADLPPANDNKPGTLLKAGDILSGQLNALRSHGGKKDKRSATYQLTSEPHKLPPPSGLCNLETGPETFQIVTSSDADVADLWALERANASNGLYHVLGATLSPLDGVGPQDLTIDALVKRAHEPQVTEIILALNATVDGQTTAHYITDLLQDANVRVTRLAHGVPVGGELDYLDEGTLSAAMRQRTLF